MGSLKEMNKRAEAAIKTSPPPPTPKPGGKSLKVLYQEWVVPAVESIKDTLVSCFGDERFEFSVVKNAGFAAWLDSSDKGDEKKNEAFLKDCLRGREQSGSGGYRYQTVYTIVIHFPELTVGNRNRRTHKMTDMWIKVQLSPFLNDTVSGHFFTGMRTSFTLADFSSGYNFSHLSGSPTLFDWAGFCLGETHFSTLCRSLSVEFNPNFFGLFCYQLEGYLSWESLEGGPYKSFEDVHERSLGGSMAPTISNTDKARYYVEYLKSGHTPSYELKSNPFYYMFHVNGDTDEMREAITKVVTKDEHLQFWDGGRKVASDRAISNRRETARAYLSQHGNSVRLKFKSKDIKFTLTDVTEKEEKDDKVKVAHQQIINYIVDNLNTGITKNIRDEFSKKRRVYTAG